MQDALVQQFHHYLNQLIEEIKAYKNPTDMWKVLPGTLNSGGNLCTHLVGNLNNYIGTVLGNTGYVRNRPLEFSIKDVPVEELVKLVEDTKSMIAEVLPLVDLEAPYPPEQFGKEGSAGFFLLRLITHLGYHLGQINYHRRGVEAG